MMIAALLTAATIAAPIQYWTPAGTNAWVGDVTVVNFKDRLHVFYLYDEHHHQAYGGKGGHVFKHLSSPDLKAWEEHPIAVGKDEPWEWIGTGTPLVKDGKLYLFYGLHSSRNGEGWEKKYPHGGTYAVSEDGVNFTKSHDIFTDDENPSPFRMKDGRLGIIHSGFSKDRGWWAADRLAGPWHKVDDTIPTEGDCPCPFEWNGWHYVIQGFVTMAASPSGKPGTYEDWVLAGDDIYGGLSVPMVVDWKDGRKLLVGWINGLDRYHEVPKGWNLQVWGGWLCFRELVQFPDGRLGTKWLAETPNRGETRVYENCAPDCPFVLTFRNETGMTVEFRIDPQEGRAQFADDGNRKQTLSEVARGLDLTKGRRIVQIAAGHLNAPYTAQNYAIGKIRGLGCPFNVKFNLYYDAKAAGTVFDAEIAGARTMVARYPGKYEMCAKETAAVNEPKISVFASFIRKVAKERGVSKTAAAAMLHSIGIRGFDAGPDEEDLEELAATKLRPINFYYSPDWLGRAGDKRYWSDKATPSECLAQAQRFGIPRIMVVPPDFTDGKENPAEFEKILEHMRSFVAEAGKLGIVVTVEDYGGNANCCSYAKYLKRMLAEIPDLKFALDSGNLYYAGRGEDILELMTFATGRIGHVHLKDQQTENNRSYVTLGLGAVPNEKIVKAVAATGYDGWYTLENPVGDTYNDTVRQAAVLRTWLSADGVEGVE